MEEFEIFSHFLINNGETDSLYVSLSSNQDMGLRAITPISMEMIEEFSSASPVITFDFIDGMGDFVNHIKPNPSTIYYLDIGRSIYTRRRITLKIISTIIVSKQAGSTERIHFKVTFAHSGWDQLISVRKNRGWNNVFHSEIVNDIANEIGFSNVDISPTISRDEFLVQPYWDNLTMLSFIRKRASTANGGHIEFGTNVSGEFFFKSIGDMIEEQKADAMAGRIPILRMEGQISDDWRRDDEYSKNDNYPTYFAHLSGSEQYSKAVSAGGGGFMSSYYDYNTDTYHRREVKYSDSSNVQMSDFASIQTSDERTRLMSYGGRYERTHDVNMNRVVDIVDSTNSLSVVMEGSITTRIGRMVELVIPVPPDVGSIIPSNIFYSGFYLISKVVHKITFKNSTMATTVDLMREGFDGKELEGYAVSKRGKFVE